MELAPYPWLVKPAEVLRRMRKQLPSALLIHGPRGSGAYELAAAFARSVICQGPVDGVACGKCDECKLVVSGNHPDLKFVFSELEEFFHPKPWESKKENVTKTVKTLSGKIKIEQIRELGEFLSVTAHRGGNRAVVVYPADSMDKDQSSALLKTLEEPPAGTVIILVADDIDRLLPTIRSRCQIVPVSPPSRSQGIAYLEKSGIKNAEAELARLGGMPLLVHESDSELVMDKSMERKFLHLLELGPQLASVEIIKSIPRDVPLAAAVAVIQRWYWDLIAATFGLPSRYYPDQKTILDSLATHLNSKKALAYNQALLETSRFAAHPLNGRLILEDLLMKYSEIFRRERANQ